MVSERHADTEQQNQPGTLSKQRLFIILLSIACFLLHVNVSFVLGLLLFKLQGFAQTIVPALFLNLLLTIIVWPPFCLQLGGRILWMNKIRAAEYPHYEYRSGTLGYEMSFPVRIRDDKNKRILGILFLKKDVCIHNVPDVCLQQNQTSNCLQI